MKYFLFISFIIYSHLAISQDDFFSIYHKIDGVFKRQNKTVSYNGIVSRLKDTTNREELIKRSNIFYEDSIFPLTRKLINMNFPDINFTDATNKAYAISDFAGKEVIVNYNYLYCQPCLDRVDSTLYLLKHRKVQFLLLFSDVYQKETGDLKNYGDNVLIGFVGEENENLISLNLGDNLMYYLDGERQIEFFDKISTLRDNEIAWTHYLKTQKK